MDVIRKLYQIEQLVNCEESPIDAKTQTENIKRFHSYFTDYDSSNIDEKEAKRLVNCILWYIDQIMNFFSQYENPKSSPLSISNSFDIVSKLVSDINVKNTFLKCATLKILDIVVENFGKTWVTTELLKTFNVCIRGSNQNLREQVVTETISYHLFKLIDMISSNGDYDLQATIVETVFRLYNQNILRNNIRSLIPESEELARSLISINTDSFDLDVRNFLNSLNDKSDKIHSVLCECIQLDEIVFVRPDGMETIGGIWVDFNMVDSVVSWYCHHRGLLQNMFSELEGESEDVSWTLITMYECDVKSVEVTRPSFAINKQFLVTIHLKSSCLSNTLDTQPIIENGRCLKLIVSNSQNAAGELISRILPKMFGPKFSHRSRRISSKRKPIYEPLDVKVGIEDEKAKLVNTSGTNSIFGSLFGRTSKSDSTSNKSLNKTKNDDVEVISIPSTGHSNLSEELNMKMEVIRCFSKEKEQLKTDEKPTAKVSKYIGPEEEAEEENVEQNLIPQAQEEFLNDEISNELRSIDEDIEKIEILSWNNTKTENSMKQLDINTKQYKQRNRKNEKVSRRRTSNKENEEHSFLRKTSAIRSKLETSFEDPPDILQKINSKGGKCVGVKIGTEDIAKFEIEEIMEQKEDQKGKNTRVSSSKLCFERDTMNKAQKKERIEKKNTWKVNILQNVSISRNDLTDEENNSEIPKEPEIKINTTQTIKDVQVSKNYEGQNKSTTQLSVKKRCHMPVSLNDNTDESVTDVDLSEEHYKPIPCTLSKEVTRLKQRFKGKICRTNDAVREDEMNVEKEELVSSERIGFIMAEETKLNQNIEFDANRSARNIEAQMRNSEENDEETRLNKHFVTEAPIDASEDAEIVGNEQEKPNFELAGCAKIELTISEQKLKTSDATREVDNVEKEAEDSNLESHNTDDVESSSEERLLRVDKSLQEVLQTSSQEVQIDTETFLPQKEAEVCTEQPLAAIDQSRQLSQQTLSQSKQKSPVEVLVDAADSCTPDNLIGSKEPTILEEPAAEVEKLPKTKEQASSPEIQNAKDSDGSENLNISKVQKKIRKVKRAVFSSDSLGSVTSEEVTPEACLKVLKNGPELVVQLCRFNLNLQKSSNTEEEKGETTFVKIISQDSSERFTPSETLSQKLAIVESKLENLFEIRGGRLGIDQKMEDVDENATELPSTDERSLKAILDSQSSGRQENDIAGITALKVQSVDKFITNEDSVKEDVIHSGNTGSKPRKILYTVSRDDSHESFCETAFDALRNESGPNKSFTKGVPDVENNAEPKNQGRKPKFETNEAGIAKVAEDLLSKIKTRQDSAKRQDVKKYKAKEASLKVDTITNQSFVKSVLEEDQVPSKKRGRKPRKTKDVESSKVAEQIETSQNTAERVGQNSSENKSKDTIKIIESFAKSVLEEDEAQPKKRDRKSNTRAEENPKVVLKGIRQVSRENKEAITNESSVLEEDVVQSKKRGLKPKKTKELESCKVAEQIERIETSQNTAGRVGENSSEDKIKGTIKINESFAEYVREEDEAQPKNRDRKSNKRAEEKPKVVLKKISQVSTENNEATTNESSVKFVHEEEEALPENRDSKLNIKPEETPIIVEEALEKPAPDSPKSSENYSHNNNSVEFNSIDSEAETVDINKFETKPTFTKSDAVEILKPAGNYKHSEKETESEPPSDKRTYLAALDEALHFEELPTDKIQAAPPLGKRTEVFEKRLDDPHVENLTTDKTQEELKENEAKQQEMPNKSFFAPSLAEKTMLNSTLGGKSGSKRRLYDPSDLTYLEEIERTIAEEKTIAEAIEDLESSFHEDIVAIKKQRRKDVKPPTAGKRTKTRQVRIKKKKPSRFEASRTKIFDSPGDYVNEPTKSKNTSMFDDILASFRQQLDHTSGKVISRVTSKRKSAKAVLHKEAKFRKLLNSSLESTDGELNEIDEAGPSNVSRAAKTANKVNIISNVVIQRGRMSNNNNNNIVSKEAGESTCVGADAHSRTYVEDVSQLLVDEHRETISEQRSRPRETQRNLKIMKGRVWKKKQNIRAVAGQFLHIYATLGNTLLGCLHFPPEQFQDLSASMTYLKKYM